MYRCIYVFLNTLLCLNYITWIICHYMRVNMHMSGWEIVDTCNCQINIIIFSATCISWRKHVTCTFWLVRKNGCVNEHERPSN
jgi:hypothetical protein